MVLSLDEAVAWVQRIRSRARTIVVTNGVFDVLHPGHVRYLQQARSFGDVLIVGLNSDRSARLLQKGRNRPVNTAAERAEVVDALACVEVVVIFDEETPHRLVSALEPDVLVKGADWAPGTIVGADVVEARGGRVERVALADGYSTTAIIERIRKPGNP